MPSTALFRIACAACLAALAVPAAAQDKVTDQLGWLPGGDKASHPEPV